MSWITARRCGRGVHQPAMPKTVRRFHHVFFFFFFFFFPVFLCLEPWESYGVFVSCLLAIGSLGSWGVVLV